MSRTFAWRPGFYDPALAAGRQEVDRLRASDQVWATHDTLAEQLLGLVESRNPRLRELPPAERRPALEAGVEKYLDGRALEQCGRWVHYPWSGRLVHLLPAAEYRELRLDRNRNKITAAEQECLAGLTIGIAGLSVGNAVALTLALEGVGGHLRLADFDHLELANMNRLRAGSHQLGLPKTVLAARQILEIDPWLEISLFSEGIRRDNVDAFFGDAPALDVLVEECDSVEVKVLLRERARSLGVPVVMETSDRGLLDVERFDQDGQRPLLHGLLPGIRSEMLTRLAPEERVKHILAFVGADTLTPRMGASMLEVERSIVTWPQLASDVVLGGATVTLAVRQLALGADLPSGRRTVDLHEQLARVELREAREPGSPRERAKAPEPVLAPLLREVLTEACLAPSGGNSQPWHFHVEGEQVWITVHAERSQSLLDAGGIAALAAIGACLENVRIAAARRDHRVEEQLFPSEEVPGLVACFRLLPGLAAEGEGLRRLHGPLLARHTNRRVVASDLLTDLECTTLQGSMGWSEARLDILRDPAALGSLGALLGEADKLRILNPALGEEMMQELRFEPNSEVEVGIALETCELSEARQLAFRMVARPDVRRELRHIGGGERLTEMTREAVEASSGLGLLSLPDASPRSLVSGGAALQRVWLEATALDLAFQPVGALTFMAGLLSRSGTSVYDPTERAHVITLYERLLGSFPELSGRSPLLLFRLHRAPPGSARSGRLPLARCVSIGRPEGAA
jgi:hypothetical protein